MSCLDSRHELDFNIPSKDVLIFQDRGFNPPLPRRVFYLWLRISSILDERVREGPAHAVRHDELRCRKVTNGRVYGRILHRRAHALHMGPRGNSTEYLSGAMRLTRQTTLSLLGSLVDQRCASFDVLRRVWMRESGEIYTNGPW